MPNLRLKRDPIVPAYPNTFRVILTMADGYELDVGGVAEQTGVSARKFWAWSTPADHGQAVDRDAAMDAIRASWPAVTEAQISTIRFSQEWTANKYALWEAGYRRQLGNGPIKCRCGQMFDPGIHDETMVHIQHVTGRRAGT
jgi:hypothetical protein